MPKHEQCTICGKFIPFGFNIDGHDHTRLTPREYKIWRLIGDVKGIRIEHLLASLYDDEPEGGPLNARTVLHVTIHRLNKKLSFIGRRIKCKKGIYQLETIHENA